MMAPISKDTVELASIAEPIVPQAETPAKPAPNPSGHLRSDALSLEVAVKVHGSRVTHAPVGAAPHTEPFEEETSTMIVFPQGGVLRLATAVNAGQMLVLTNSKTRQDAICRVVKVRANPNLPGYIEVEFTHPQPGFWGANFPSQPPAAPSQSLSAPISAQAQPEINEKDKPASDVSWKPATPPVTVAPLQPAADLPTKETKAPLQPSKVAPLPKPEPSFISIGSQEEVQPFASATATIKPGRVSDTGDTGFASSAATPAVREGSSTADSAHSAPKSTVQTPAIEPLAPLTSIDFAEVEEPRRIPMVGTQSSSENTQPVFGRFSSAAAMTEGHQASAENFATLTHSSHGTLAASSAKSSRSWMLPAAAVAALALGLLGGILYFRGQSSPSSTPKNGPASSVAPVTSPAPATTPRPAPTANQPPLASVARPSSYAAAPTVAPGGNSAATPVSRAFPAAAASASVAAPSATPPQPTPSAPTAEAKAAMPSVTTAMVTEALNAHPSAPQRDNSEDADAAPVITPGAGAGPETNALEGIASSSGPAAPVKTGGVVTEPQLKSSVLPVYPLAARQSNVQGDVVINTTIDAAGNVTQMKVVSGPAMLRQAALDALKRWKYEPSKLDGQPVEVQMLVTIKFRR